MAEHVMYRRETWPVSFTDAGDVVTTLDAGGSATAHGLSNGQPVEFNTITSTTGISVETTYYVVGVATNTFQVAATPGGTALTLTTNGTGEVGIFGKYFPPLAQGTPLGTSGAIPVESFNVVPAINFMELTDTGPGGRGRPAMAPGEIAVNGTLTTKLYPQVLGRFFHAIMGTRAVAAQTDSTTYAISAGTIGDPTVLTIATHTLKVGDSILIAGSTTAVPPINGIHYITAVPDNTHIALDIQCSTGAGNAGTVARTLNRNKLLFNDNKNFDSFSFQKYYDSTHAEYVRGCKITKFGVSVRSKEFAKFNMEFVGKDATKNAGTWADATSAPAITAYTHATTGAAGSWFYPPVIYDPLKFYQARISTGGIVTVTNGELVVSGQTARTEIDNLAINVDLGLGTDAYGVLFDDRTRQSIDEGPRLVTLSFEPNFKAAWFEFYDYWKANPQQGIVIEAYFRGPLLYGTTYLEYKFVFPNVRISSAPPPDQNAAYGLKRQTVTAQAAVDPATGYDLGLAIQSPEDYTY